MRKVQSVFIVFVLALLFSCDQNAGDPVYNKVTEDVVKIYSGMRSTAGYNTELSDAFSVAAGQLAAGTPYSVEGEGFSLAVVSSGMFTTMTFDCDNLESQFYLDGETSYPVTMSGTSSLSMNPYTGSFVVDYDYSYIGEGFPYSRITCNIMITTNFLATTPEDLFLVAGTINIDGILYNANDLYENAMASGYASLFSTMY